MRHLLSSIKITILLLILLCPVFAGDNPITRVVKEEILSVLISDSTVRAYARIEIPDERNVTVHDDYLSLHLFEGQELLFNGVRSEVTVDLPYEEHDTVVYQWEVMIPNGFQHDAPENRWWNVVQWHDQPDLTLGETWADLTARSPVISLHLKFYEGGYYFAPRYMHVEPPMEDLIEIQPGEWIKLRFEIRWSQGNDGYLKIHVNDDQLPHVHYTEPNMHNGYQHYLKIGMYRHPDIATDNTINLRNLYIWNEGSSGRSVRDHRVR